MQQSLGTESFLAGEKSRPHHHETSGLAGDQGEHERAHGLPLRPLDRRLRRALALQARALAVNLPVGASAAAARLSPSRLMALAHEQLQSSLRAHRRWLRTFAVARAYAAGASLTEAALAAGFSSSAHLSTATRDHFGIRPSDVLTAANRPAIVTL